MIDFAGLVLGPAMAVFGQPATFTPTVSQPSALPYAGRGVFDFKAVEIPLEDGSYHSTNQPTLGVRLADFSVVPKQGDSVALAGATYEIVDVIPDGQGKADLMLRRVDAPENSA